MRKIFSLALILLFSVAAYSQRGGNRLEKMKEHLELTDAQAQEIAAIYESYKPKFEALKTAEGEKGTKREEMQALRASMNDEVKAKLSDAQIAKLEEMKGNRKGKRKGQVKNMMHKRRGVMKDKIHPIALEQRAAFDKELSRKDRNTIAELRTVIKEEREAHRAEMKAMKEKFKEGEKPSKEEMGAIKEQFKAKKEAFKNSGEMKILEALVNKYEKDLTTYMEPIEAAVEAERANAKERRATMDKEGKGARGKGMKRGKAKSGKHANMSEEDKALMKSVKFLLLDHENDAVRAH
ncbi:MAG: hypothetical protein AAGK97_08755 [Bacteroidota bacterium]